jgi:hypothetical protein
VDVADLVLGVCRVVRLSVVKDLLYGVKLWKGACGRLERRVAELESELGEARLERDEAVRERDELAAVPGVATGEPDAAAPGAGAGAGVTP